MLQLLGLDAPVAQAIVAGREGEDDGTGAFGPYKSLQDLIIKVPLLPRALPPQITQFCDVHSQCFEVHVEAQVANYKRQFTAILARNSPRNVDILNFYWK